MLTYERLEDITSCHDAKPYSGRGMSGRQCLSVQTEDGQSVLKLMADLITGCDDVMEAAELMRLARTDSMGRDTVVYWPSVKMPEQVS